MPARRRHRLVTVLFALFALLSMQLAVAAYTCPSASMAVAGAPCAGAASLGMDQEQPGLCQAHCQSTQQNVDKVQSPAPVPLLAGNFVYAIEPARLVVPAQPTQLPSLARTTAPPIAVRNCCFRI